MASKLTGLDALRGIACFSVVLFHLQDVAGRYGGELPFGGWFGAGDRGVDLFFVLSGFIITWAHASDVGVPGRTARYAVRRASRIFPAVWIVTAMAAIVYLMQFGGAAKAGKLEPWNVVASLLLLPQRQPALVNVTWTLTYEALFYVLFGVLILRVRLGLLLLCAWQLAVALAALGVVPASNWLIDYYLRPMGLEFGMGMAAAQLVARTSRNASNRAGTSWAGVALALSGGAVYFGGVAAEGIVQHHVLEPARLLFYGLAPAALISGLALVERRRPIRVPAALRWLGAVSYALYLLNFSVVTLGWLLLAVRLSIPPGVAGLACVGLALAAAGLFHAWIDTPIQRALRRLAPGARHPGGSAPVAAGQLSTRPSG